MARRLLSLKSINDVNLPNDMFKDMSIEFLQTLSNQDESTFVEFFQQLSLPNVKEARQKCQNVLEENRALALKNSEVEPKFNEQKEELRSLVTQAEELKAGYDTDYQELKRYQSKMELATLKKQLQEATKNSEQASEDFAYEYVNGKSSMSVEEFVESLVTKRSEYWLRKVKLEKFSELSKTKRPVPAPRTKTEGPPVPYQAPPMQSLPLGHSAPSRSTGFSPTASLPPYPVSTAGSMPKPSQQPFPTASYPGYRQPNPGYLPTRPAYPAASRGYPPAGPGYPAGPPPRPTAYRPRRY